MVRLITVCPSVDERGDRRIMEKNLSSQGRAKLWGLIKAEQRTLDWGGRKQKASDVFDPRNDIIQE